MLPLLQEQGACDRLMDLMSCGSFSCSVDFGSGSSLVGRATTPTPVLTGEEMRWNICRRDLPWLGWIYYFDMCCEEDDY
jgi:hypothetical protein